MKSIFSLGLAIAALPLVASAYVFPGDPSGFVNDYASLFSEKELTTLESELSAYEQETTHEIAVVTIRTLEGDTIENYAVELFEDWGIGKKDKDNGILILIALEDRKMRIEVGYGLEGNLTDAQASWIINEVMRPAFRNGRYFEGIQQAVRAVKDTVSGEAVISPEDVSDSPRSEFSEAMEAFLSWVFFGIFGAAWFAGILARSKSWWGGGVVGATFGFIAGIGTSLIAALLFLAAFGLFGALFDYVVSRAYKKGKASGTVPWWAGGNRSWGSGSSRSSGSSGGFGGGSSGGGGASGSW